MSSVNISLSLKYNKTLKALPRLMTNIAPGFACAIFATRLSPRAIYFIQTDTYGEHE